MRNYDFLPGFFLFFLLTALFMGLSMMIISTCGGGFRFLGIYIWSKILKQQQQKKMKKRWRIVSVDRPCQTALRRILPEGLPVQDNNSNNNKKMPRTTAYIGNTHTQVCRHSPCHCKTLAVFWPFYVFWSFDHQTDLFFFLCYLTCFF